MNEISDYLAFLLDLMEREISYQEQILGVAREKKKLLLENHLEELLSCIRQEEKLVLQARDVEEEMSRVWKKMCDEYELNVPELRVSALIDLAGNELAQDLTEAKERLTSIVQNLEEANRQNTLLIQEALHYVNIVFSLLVDGPLEKKSNQGYDSRNKKENTGKYLSGMLVDGTV